jgi:hypothetical protein
MPLAKANQLIFLVIPFGCHSSKLINIYPGHPLRMPLAEANQSIIWLFIQMPLAEAN